MAGIAQKPSGQALKLYDKHFKYSQYFRKVSNMVSRSTFRFPLHIALSILIIFDPIASGMRGFSHTFGRSMILASDLSLIIIAVVFGKLLTDNRLKLALIVAVAALVCTLFIPNFPPEGIVGGLRKSFLILVAFIVGSYVRPENRNTVHRTIILSCSIVCLYGIKQHFFFTQFDMSILESQSSDVYTNLFKGEHRAFSLLSSGFHAGEICLIAMAYCLFSRVMPRNLLFLIFVISSTALFFTYTRTCWIIGVAMILCKIARVMRVPVSIAGLVTVAIYISLIVAAPDVVPNPLVAATEDTRFTGRSSSYIDAANAWSDHPLKLATGFGVGSAGSAQAEMFNEVGVEWIEPHNTFLKYIFEMGAFFGIIFIVSIFSAIVTSARNARIYGEKDLVLALWFAVVFSGLTITVVEAWPANVFYFLIFGLYLNKGRLIGESRVRFRSNSGAGEEAPG